MHEKHRASLESTRKREQWTNTIENQTTEKLQQRKGAKKRREGITRREFPSPRPIKKSSTKRSKHLITEIYIYIYISLLLVSDLILSCTL